MDPDGNRLQNSSSPRHWGGGGGGALDHALSAPSVWDYNYYLSRCTLTLLSTGQLDYSSNYG